MHLPPGTLRLLALGLCLASSVAGAQATRTWVSGVGDDVNPCSRTAPCRTFAGAVSKTAAGGQLSVLDRGHYGALTITKALTVDGSGLASMDGASVPVIRVQAGAGDVVVLRRLTLGAVQSGTSGIHFVSGKALHVEDCDVHGYSGHGVDFQPAAGGNLFVRGLRASGNGGAGVYVASSSGRATAVVTRSTLRANAVGLAVGEGGRATAAALTAAGNAEAGVAAVSGASGSAELNVEGATLSQNPVGVRVAAAGGGARVRLSRALLVDNAQPVQREGGGELLSFGNNRVVGDGFLLSSRMALTASATSLTLGAPLTLTARVESDGGEPTGTVTFRSAETVLGRAALAGGTATLEVPALPAGRHAFSATYDGNGHFGASNSEELSVEVLFPPAPDAGTPGASPGAEGAQAGCGCGSSGGSPLGAGTLLLLAALAWRRARGLLSRG